MTFLVLFWFLTGRVTTEVQSALDEADQANNSILPRQAKTTGNVVIEAAEVSSPEVRNGTAGPGRPIDG